MYKNDLKRGNDNERAHNGGMRRARVSPTPFEIMQMEAARNRSMIPHTNRADPSSHIRDNGVLTEENDSGEKVTVSYLDEESQCTEINETEHIENKSKEIIKEYKIQNAPIGRDELLIGALLAFLLFSDEDNDIVLIGILIFLLI